MGSPIDRTNKTALDTNLVNGVTSDAPKLKASNDTVYNYVDTLNSGQDAHAGAATLAHPDGSVTTAKLANGSVTTAKIADGAVTAAKVADGSLTAGKFVAGVLSNETANGLQIVALQGDVIQRGINVKYPPAPLVAAKGDGVTDDWAVLQAIFDYAYEYGVKVFFPKGIFIVTKPLIIYGKSADYDTVSTFIEGSGRNVTTIKKTTNAPLGTGEYSTIDSIFIIGNEYIKNSTPITDYFSSQVITQKIFISSLTLESGASASVGYGIYSFGIYQSRFFNLNFKNVATAMKTSTFNVMNTFERIDVFTATVCSFDFLTPIGGNTTMNFIDCHLNGCDGYGFKIKGSAIFTNCAIDGGALTGYYFEYTGATLINCHFESPYASKLIEAVFSEITVIRGSCESPMFVGSIALKAQNGSYIHLIDTGIFRAARGAEFPSTSEGKLIETDLSSRIIFDNAKISIEHDVVSYPVFSEADKKTVFDKNHMNPPNSHYVSYVPSTETVTSVLTTTINSTTKTIDCTNVFGFGLNNLMFATPLNFDHYSKLYMKADLTFPGGGDSSYAVELRIQDQVRSGVYEDIPAPFIRKDLYFYSLSDYEFWVDISDLYGTYYVEVMFSNNSTVVIKEISLLR